MLKTDFNRHVGIRVVGRHADGVTVDCALRPELMNFSGILHGGVTATLADVAVGQALTHHLKRPATTVELKINYLLPVTGRKVRARSHSYASERHSAWRAWTCSTIKRISRRWRW